MATRRLTLLATLLCVLLTGLLPVGSVNAQSGTDFPQLPAGATLPTDCTTRVVRSNLEHRPENDAANRYQAVAGSDYSLPSFSGFRTAGNALRTRVDGAWHGTTEDMARYYSCKWGHDTQWLRAQMWKESSWRQSMQGDYNQGCDWKGVNGPEYWSFSIIQIKKCAWEVTHPASEKSTAFALDYFGYWLRVCVNGDVNYFGNGYSTATDRSRGCRGAWFSGSYFGGTAEETRYLSQMDTAHRDSPWTTLSTSTVTSYSDTTTTNPTPTPTPTPAPSGVPGANMVPNGGFEDGATGWTNWCTGGCLAFEVLTSPVHSGTRAARGGGQTSATIAFTAGRTYRLSFWAINSLSGSDAVTMSLGVPHATGSSIVCTTASGLPQWTQKTCEFTASSSTTSILHISGNGAYDDIVLVDINGGVAPSTCVQAAAAALSKKGSPYVWGAKGPNEFDCSGLTYWAYGQAGIEIGLSTYDQVKDGTPIGCTLNDLKGTNTTCWQPGDLMFLKYPDGQHVSMYVGDGLNMDCYNPTVDCIVHDVSKDSGYQKYWWQARRIVGDCEGTAPSPGAPSTPSGDPGWEDAIPDLIDAIDIIIPQCEECGGPNTIAWSKEPEPLADGIGEYASFKYWFSWLGWKFRDSIRALVCTLLAALQLLANGIALGFGTVIRALNRIWSLMVNNWLGLIEIWLAMWAQMEMLRLTLHDYFGGGFGFGAVQAWLNAILQLLYAVGELLLTLLAMLRDVAYAALNLLGYIGGLMMGGIYALLGSSGATPTQLTGTDPVYYIVHGFGRGLVSSQLRWVIYLVWAMCYAAFFIWAAKFFSATSGDGE